MSVVYEEVGAGSTFFRIATNAASRFLVRTGLLSEADIENMGGVGDRLVATSRESEEDEKAYNYMLAMAARDPELADSFRIAQTGGMIGGWVLDIWTAIKLASPISGAAASVGEYSRTVGLKSRMGRVMSVPIVPNLIKWTAEDTFMTIADVTREVYNDEITRHEWMRNRAGRAALLFGENFMYDMLFWNVAKYLKAGTKAAGRAFTGLRKKAEAAARAGVSPDQLGSVDWMRSEIGKIDPASISSLPEATRIELWRETTRRLSDGSLSLRDVGSDEWVQLFMQSKGYEMIPQAGGGFELRTLHELVNGKPTSRVASLGVYGDVPSAFERFMGDLEMVVSGPDTARAGSSVLRQPGQPMTARVGAELGSRVSVTEIATGRGVREEAGRLSLDALDGLLVPGSDGRLADGNIRTAVRTITDQSSLLPNATEVSVRRMDNAQYKRLANKHGGMMFIENGRVKSASSYLDEVAKSGATAAQKKRRLQQVQLVVPDGPVSGDDIVSIRNSLNQLVDNFQGQRGLKPGQKRSLKAVSNRLAASTENIKNQIGTESVVKDFEGLGKELINPRTGAKVTAETMSQMPASGAVSVRDAATGNIRSYSSLSEARLAELPTDWLTDDVLKTWLDREWSLELTQSSADGRYRLRRGKDLLRGDYASIDDLLAKNSELFPKRPITGVQNVEFDYLSGEMSVRGKTLSGPPEEVHRYMNQTFADYTSKQSVISTAVGNVQFTPGDPLYRVSFNDFAFSRDFSTLEEAKTFLREGMDNLATLQDIASSAGAKIEPANGFFRLIVPKADGTAQEYASRTLEGLKTHLSKLDFESPAVVELMDAFALPENFMNELKNKVKKFAAGSLNTPRMDRQFDAVNKVRDTNNFGKGFSRRLDFDTFFRPVGAVIEDFTQMTGKPELTKTLYDRLLRSADVVRQKMSAVDQTVAQAFRGTNKKQSQAIAELLINPSADPVEVFARYKANYDPVQVERIRSSVREIFDVGAQEFQIDGFKFWQDYFPRMREYFAKTPNAQLGESAHELFRKMGFSDSIPEVRFFAENLRTRDIFEMTDGANRGAEEMIRKYFHKGFRKKYMGQAVSEAKNAIDVIAKTGEASPEFLRYLVGWVEDIQGSAADPAKTALIEGMNEAFSEILTRMNGGKRVNAPSMDRLTKLLRNTTISSQMAFRPWLPIRNLTQPFTTLSWRLGAGGNEAVVRAMERASNFGPRELENLIRQDIIIHGKQDMMRMLNLGDNALAKLNSLGMTFMSNSDDFNRVVTALSTGEYFDNAYRKLLNGNLNVEQFIDQSTIGRLRSSRQRDILNFVELGQIDRAKNIFTKEWIDMTQYTYVAPTNPRIFKGLAGSIFGTYGHWPISYVENLRQAFASGHISMGRKLESATMLAMNTAALYSITDRVLGLNASNFNPVAMSVFGGGPYYDILNTALQSFQPGFRGDLARSRIGEDVARTFIPGSSFFYAQRQAQDFFNRGLVYEGVMRSLTFPVNDPRRPNAR